LLSAPQEQNLLDQAEFSQPCLIAIQVALVELFRSWGVVPSAVVGHSSGETAAAFATGAITAEEAILIAYNRGQITRLIKAAHNGGMAAVGLGRKQVESFLRPGVIIGCENSPENVTLSGDSDVLRSILLEISFQQPEVVTRSLRVECGYHSRQYSLCTIFGTSTPVLISFPDHMQAAAADFTSRLEGLQLQNKEPLIPYYSSVTGERNTDMSPAYWVRNAISPVLFNNAVQAVLDDFKSPIFVEIGPHSALAGPIRQILQFKKRTAQYIPTLIRNQHAVLNTLNTAGELWLAGASIDIAAVNPAGDYLTDLPTYPWQYDEEYWAENRLSRSWRHRKFKHHELLGSRVEEIGDACPAWRCNLRSEDVPWLRDHVVGDETVFPASGFICMVVEALKQLKGSVDFSLGRISILAALVLDDQPVELVTILQPAHSNTTSETTWYNFSISSLNEGSEVWVKHISGLCRGGSSHQRLAPELSLLPRNVSAKSFYNTWKRFGLNYGTNFRGLASVTSHVTEARAIGMLEHRSTICDDSAYTIHPATLDTSMHVTMIAACQGLERNFCRLEVPTYIHEVYIGKPTGQVQVSATVETKGHSTSKSNIIGVSNGQVVIDISGLQVSTFGGSSENEEDDPHAGAVLTWMPDIDFDNAAHQPRPRKAADYVPILDELVLACIVDLKAQVSSLSSTQPHSASFKAWLDVSYEEAMKRKYENVPNSVDIATMNQESRVELVSRLMEASMRTTTADIAQAVLRVHKYGTDSILGYPDAVEMLTQPSHFTGLSSLLHEVDLSDFLRLLGHKTPKMNILHINPTPEFDGVLSVLFCQKEGHRPYGSYVYTSASAKQSELMEKRMGSVPCASYKQLMMEIDPTSQGFSEKSFDLIICDPMPLLPSHAVFVNLRKLLRPQGRMILQQMNPGSKILHLAYGLSPNFYPPPDDHTLRDQLVRAGFDEPSIVSCTGRFSRVTIAKPCIKPLKPETASVLCQDANHPLVADATRHLQSNGTLLQFFSPGQELPCGKPVICLLDLESPFLHDVTQPQWGELKESLLSAQDEKWLWITAASQIECKDPRYALTLGVTRSIRRELVMDLVTLELDHFGAKGWNAMTTLFDSLDNRASGGDTQAESEYAFSNDSIQICRFHHVKIADELREKCESAPKHLRISKPGSLQTLHWEEAEADPFSGDDIQVEVKAVGLNTKVCQSYDESLRHNVSRSCPGPSCIIGEFIKLQLSP
jgi:malonyl CoA-acyl carrier protein transacylase